MGKRLLSPLKISRIVRWALARLLVLAPLLSAILAQGTEPVRFTDIQMRLLSSGANQPVQELGVFSASLPLGKPGYLQREVTITNQTKGASCKLDLDLTVTCAMGEDSYLHCVAMSDATPVANEKVSRVRELVLKNPGEQIMELFADKETGSRLLLALKATLAAPIEMETEVKKWPRLLFFLKVEQWAGAKRTQIDNLQLASEDGGPVVHNYKREVPRWVEPALRSTEQDPLADFPILDTSSEAVKMPAGQSFSVMLPEKGHPDKKQIHKKSGDNNIWTLADPGAEASPVEHERKLEWVTESFSLTITPVSLDKGLLTVRVSGSGEIIENLSGKPQPIPYREQAKGLRNAEPMPFYLTVESEGGGRGYAIWIVPEWK